MIWSWNGARCTSTHTMGAIVSQGHGAENQAVSPYPTAQHRLHQRVDSSKGSSYGLPRAGILSPFHQQTVTDPCGTLVKASR